jgi:hypothetical protein
MDGWVGGGMRDMSSYKRGGEGGEGKVFELVGGFVSGGEGVGKRGV